MKLHIIFSGIYKIAGSLLAFLFMSVTANAQDYQSLSPVQNEMTSLKRLVLGINDTNNYRRHEVKVLKNIDFEMYVEREILIEKWMHDKDSWMHGRKDKNDTTPLEDWMYKNGAWKLIDSDLGILQKPEPEPEIQLAGWMYADGFIHNNNSASNSSRLETWMGDRSFWVMKK